jgi:hypothetical protein
LPAKAAPVKLAVITPAAIPPLGITPAIAEPAITAKTVIRNIAVPTETLIAIAHTTVISNPPIIIAKTLVIAAYALAAI